MCGVGRCNMDKVKPQRSYGQLRFFKSSRKRYRAVKESQGAENATSTQAKALTPASRDTKGATKAPVL